MSGGHFNYKNDDVCSEIYNWEISPNYGDRGFALSKIARRINPLEDFVISEIVFDVFCLLHSFDWYESGDTCEETYRKDVKRFKDKWLKPFSEIRTKEIIDDEISDLRDKLYQVFDIEPNRKGGETNG